MFSRQGGLTREEFSSREHLYVPDEELNPTPNIEIITLPWELFNESPNPARIAQGNYGNCFLIAPLISIASSGLSGQQHLNNMMIDLGELVIVRLYHPKTLKPIFIQLDRTVFLCRNKKNVKYLEINDLWVYFIEKAFAAYVLKFPSPPVHATFLHSAKNYENALDGTLDIKSTFKIILGKSTVGRLFAASDISRYSEEPLFSIFNNPFETMSLLNTLAFHQSFILCRQTDIFNENIFKFLTIVQSLPRDTLQNFLNSFPENNKTMRLHEIQAFFKIHFHQLHPVFLDAIFDYLKTKVPGKRGLCIYNDVQEALFFAIYSELQKKALLCLGTKSNFNSQKGLYPLHVYSVINCYQRGNFKFVLLVNPHACDTRQYFYDPSGLKITTANETLAGKTMLHPGLPYTRMGIEQSPEQIKELLDTIPGCFELLLEDVSKRCQEITYYVLT